jgi:Mn2+/Fe2+ NRAMP family transporter
LQIWGSYRLITNLFKWLTLTLFAFILAGVLAKPDLRQVIVRTLVPTLRFDTQYVSTLVAFVGTALSPYLYFWQTSQRVEEEVCMGRRRLWQRQGATDGELKYAALDVNTGMTVACVVIYFIILATAATLWQAAARDGRPPPEINSARDAAAALEPVAGKLAGVLFALGFIGAGLLAVPVLTTGASYAVADAFGWKSGLDQRFRAAPQFYAVMILSTLAGTAINFVGISPMTALFWAAVVNGLLAPPVLVLVMLISRNRAVMGDRTSTRWQSVLGWTTAAVTFAAAVSFLVSVVRD